VFEMWLYEAVRRQRLEHCLTVIYMKPCVDRLELWPTVGYMMLYLDRDQKCGRELVT